MTVKGEKSLACETSKVRIKLARRSAANRSGFRSMQTFLAISKKHNIDLGLKLLTIQQLWLLPDRKPAGDS